MTGEFLPHPLLAGGHLQTIVGLYLPVGESLPATQQHILTLPDGDQLVLHENCPPAWRATDPSVVLIHGLCGSHQSPYVRRMAWKLYQANVRTFRLDLRGSGAGGLLARTGTHCGRWNDLEIPIEAITELAPNSPLTLLGFSLGAALALNLAAELGETSLGNWSRTVAVCPPVDLVSVAQHLRRPMQRSYDRFFTRRLWRSMVERSQKVPGAPSVSHLRPPRRLREFDELITAPFGGYASADQYYRLTSVAPRLHQIQMPTLIIAASNDPIVPIGPLTQAVHGPNTKLIVTRCGGHLGYVGRVGSDPDRRWMDWRILEWLEVAPSPAREVHHPENLSLGVPCV